MEGEDYFVDVVNQFRQFLITENGYIKLSSFFRDERLPLIQKSVIEEYFGGVFEAEMPGPIAKEKKADPELELRRAKMIQRIAEGPLWVEMTDMERRRMAAAVVNFLAGDVVIEEVEQEIDITEMTKSESAGPRHCEAENDPTKKEVDLFSPTVGKEKIAQE